MHLNKQLLMQVSRVHEEFFPPGKVIMEQGSVVDQLYFISDGKLVRNSYVKLDYAIIHEVLYKLIQQNCYRKRLLSMKVALKKQYQS